MWISQLQWKWSPQQTWHRWTTRKCCSCFLCTFCKTQIVGIEQGGNPWNVCLFVKHVEHNPSICCPQEHCFAHPARHVFLAIPTKTNFGTYAQQQQRPQGWTWRPLHCVLCMTHSHAANRAKNVNSKTIYICPNSKYYVNTCLYIFPHYYWSYLYGNVSK